jgi:signal transduction histidine kinase
VGFEAAGAAVQWVASTIAADALLGEMMTSTTRISELVAAVKSYSQMDQAALQKVDIRQGIESTLVMLSHQLGDIVVERSFADGVPAIEAYGAELNQVWTNLIYNAIDAMGDKGTLRVSTRQDIDSILVEVADTGHGMTAEVEARALEPFFTTKDVGRGAGLGLDMVRRIVVERHHGSISFSSGAGGTTVTVQIPIST